MINRDIPTQRRLKDAPRGKNKEVAGAVERSRKELAVPWLRMLVVLARRVRRNFVGVPCKSEKHQLTRLHGAHRHHCANVPLLPLAVTYTSYRPVSSGPREKLLKGLTLPSQGWISKSAMWPTGCCVMGSREKQMNHQK